MLLVRFISILLVIAFAGCASSRTPVPIGEIPAQDIVLSEDEQYGHQVFSQLAGRFPIDSDDSRIFRVRNIVEQLTAVRGNNQNIWHVHVFKDDNFKNAAATKGNYIFVWSGLINTVEDDAELATILAHEIGHVLAGHTNPDPAEEVNEMLASVAAQTAQSIMSTSASSTVGGLAGLGGLVAAEVLKAIFINPNQQELELEADRLGLFIMAEAGFNPEKAISFWDRMKNDPSFGSAPIDFLSTHPSSQARLNELKIHLPKAIDRYHGKSTPSSSSFVQSESKDLNTSKDSSFVVDAPSESPKFQRTTTDPRPIGTNSFRQEEVKIWKVMDEDTPVFSEPRRLKSLNNGRLTAHETVTVDFRDGRWLKITAPISGYVESYHLSPLK